METKTDITRERPISPFTRVVAWITLAAFLSQPMVAAAEIVADPNAGRNRPDVGTAGKNVPVVQITAPSASGVSRNHYTRFDVDRQGAILNNSAGSSSTKLGGTIGGNTNLTGGSARIILNEVTSSNPSYLRGYLEVAGQRADVVIANPNGITCNGCGFINAGSGVLTTGTPIFGAGGTLGAFHVTRGVITVEGAGLNASNIDRVDLLGRAVKINASIWANQLNVVTGANDINRTDLGIQTITGEGDRPTVAIDVSSLGGMYAGTILLVGTEHGVGVSSNGTIAARGEFSLTNDGTIVLSGLTSARGINISATDSIENRNRLYSTDYLHISTPGNFTNESILAAQGTLSINANNLTSTGLIAAGAKPTGEVNNDGSLLITVNRDVLVIDQQLISGGLLSIIAGNSAGNSIDLSGSTVQSRSNMFLSSLGYIRVNGANLLSEGDLNMASSWNFYGNASTLKSKYNIGITAATMDLSAADISSVYDTRLASSGSIINKGGKIQAGGKIGGSEIDGNLIVTAAGKFDSTQGSVEAGNVQITANEIDLGNSKLKAVKNMWLQAPNILNTHGDIEVGNYLSAVTSSNFDNTSGMVNAGYAQLTVGNILNSLGTISSNGDIFISTSAYAGGGTIHGNGTVSISAKNAFSNNGGTLIGGDLVITASSIDLTGSKQVQAIASADKTTGLPRGGGVYLTAVNGDIKNTGNTILAGGDVLVSSATGTYSVSVGNVVTSATGTFDNTRGRVLSGGSIWINADKIISIGTGDDESDNGSAMIGAKRDVYLFAKKSFLNKDGSRIFTVAGDIVIAGGFDKDGDLITTPTVTNSSATIVAGTGSVTQAQTDKDGNILKNADGSVKWETVDKGGNVTIVTKEFTNKLTNDDPTQNSGYPSEVYRVLDLPSGTWSRTKEPSEYIKNLFNQYCANHPATCQSITINAYCNANAADCLKAIKNIQQNSHYCADHPEECKNMRIDTFCADHPADCQSLINTAAAYSQPWESIASSSSWAPGSVSAHPGQILADGNISIMGGGNYVNKYAQIIAGGSISAPDSNGIQNKSLTIPYNLYIYPFYADTVTFPQTFTYTGKYLQNAQFSKGDVVPNAAATPVTNSVTGSTIGDMGGGFSFRAPNGGLFTLSTAPKNLYLIETNPIFKSLYSTDYLIKLLGEDPSKQDKRLGDGYYEQTMVMDEVVSLTGRRFLAGCTVQDAKGNSKGCRNADDQFLALMVAGAEEAQKNLKLSIGVALTPDQINNLQKSIIWLVKVKVNGQEVLAPKLYLAKVDTENMRPNGVISASNDIYLNSRGRVNNTGTIMAGKNTTIMAGNINTAGGTITSGETTYLRSFGNINARQSTVSGQNVFMVANKNVDITAANLSTHKSADGKGGMKGGTGQIYAGGSVLGDVVRHESVDKNGVTTVTYDVTTINAPGGFHIFGNEGIKLVASQLQGGEGPDEAITLYSNKDISVIAAVGGVIGKNEVVSKATITGGSVQITSTGGTVLIEGSNVHATKDAVMISGNDIVIKEAKEHHETKDTKTKVDEQIQLASGSTVTVTWDKRTTTGSWDKVIGSSITSDYVAPKEEEKTQKKDEDNKCHGVCLFATNDLLVQGSEVSATKGGFIYAQAGNDLTIKEARQQVNSTTESTRHDDAKWRGNSWTSGSSESTDVSSQRGVQGDYVSPSYITGSSVVLKSTGHDVIVQGSHVRGGGGVFVDAAHDVKVLAGANYETSTVHEVTKTAGWSFDIGSGLRVGENTQTVDDKRDATTYQPSLIHSAAGQVSITAGNDVRIVGSDVTSGMKRVAMKDDKGNDLKDANGAVLYMPAIQLIGNRVMIEAAQNEVKSTTTVDNSGWGLTLNVSLPILDKARDIITLIKGADKKENSDKLRVAYGAKTLMDAYDIVDTVSQNGPVNGLDIRAGVSLVNSSNTTHTTATTAVGSNITAYVLDDKGNPVLDADGKPTGAGDVYIKSKRGDIAVVGSKVDGLSVSYDSARSLIFAAAENRTDTKRESSGWTWDGGFSLKYDNGWGIGNYFQGTFNGGTANETNVTHVLATSNASENMYVKSAGDTTLVGATLKGKKIEGHIGGDLNIVSLQDAHDYHGDTWNINGETSGHWYGGNKFDFEGTASGTLNKTDARYRAVGEGQQSGLFAGSGGYDISVGGNTSLVGGVISSEAPKEKNQFSTTSLTYSNIINTSEYTSYGGNANVSFSGSVNKTSSGNNGKSYSGSFGGSPQYTSGGDGSSVTSAAISPGTITVGGRTIEDNEGPSRDAQHANQIVSDKFDLEKVKKDIELQKVVGDIANQATAKLKTFRIGENGVSWAGWESIEKMKNVLGLRPPEAGAAQAPVPEEITTPSTVVVQNGLASGNNATASTPDAVGNPFPAPSTPQSSTLVAQNETAPGNNPTAATPGGSRNPTEESSEPGKGPVLGTVTTWGDAVNRAVDGTEKILNEFSLAEREYNARQADNNLPSFADLKGVYNKAAAKAQEALDPQYREAENADFFREKVTDDTVRGANDLRNRLNSCTTSDCFGKVAADAANLLETAANADLTPLDSQLRAYISRIGTVAVYEKQRAYDQKIAAAKAADMLTGILDKSEMDVQQSVQQNGAADPKLRAILDDVYSKSSINVSEDSSNSNKTYKDILKAKANPERFYVSDATQLLFKLIDDSDAQKRLVELSYDYKAAGYDQRDVYFAKLVSAACSVMGCVERVSDDRPNSNWAVMVDAKALQQMGGNLNKEVSLLKNDSQELIDEYGRHITSYFQSRPVKNFFASVVADVRDKGYLTELIDVSIKSKYESANNFFLDKYAQEGHVGAPSLLHQAAMAYLGVEEGLYRSAAGFVSMPIMVVDQTVEFGADPSLSKIPMLGPMAVAAVESGTNFIEKPTLMSGAEATRDVLGVIGLLLGAAEGIKGHSAIKGEFKSAVELEARTLEMIKNDSGVYERASEFGSNRTMSDIRKNGVRSLGVSEEKITTYVEAPAGVDAAQVPKLPGETLKPTVLPETARVEVTKYEPTSRISEGTISDVKVPEPAPGVIIRRGAAAEVPSAPRVASPEPTISAGQPIAGTGAEPIRVTDAPPRVAGGENRISSPERSFGDLPSGSKVLAEGDSYIVYKNAVGQERIRFKADEAVTYQPKPRVNNTAETLAALNEDGKVFVHEGRHRVVDAARGAEIPRDLGGVAGQPGILDYEFSRKVTNEKGKPAKNLNPLTGGGITTEGRIVKFGAGTPEAPVPKTPELASAKGVGAYETPIAVKVTAPEAWVGAPSKSGAITQAKGGWGTPEYYVQLHRVQFENLRKEPRIPNPVISNDPIPHQGTFRVHGADDLAGAVKSYEEALQRTGWEKEVGIWRNVNDGTYSVQIGSELGVAGPNGARGEWECVGHNHPIPKENPLALRNPAGMDLVDTGQQAYKAQRPIREFIDYRLPDGNVGRTFYEIQPSATGRITDSLIKVDYDAGGSLISKEFDNFKDYLNDYNSRTRYIDPSLDNSQYTQLMESTKKYVDSRLSRRGIEVDGDGISENLSSNRAGMRGGSEKVEVNWESLKLPGEPASGGNAPSPGSGAPASSKTPSGNGGGGTGSGDGPSFTNELGKGTLGNAPNKPQLKLGGSSPESVGMKAPEVGQPAKQQMSWKEVNARLDKAAKEPMTPEQTKEFVELFENQNLTDKQYNKYDAIRKANDPEYAASMAKQQAQSARTLEQNQTAEGPSFYPDAVRKTDAASNAKLAQDVTKLSELEKLKPGIEADSVMNVEKRLSPLTEEIKANMTKGMSPEESFARTEVGQELARKGYSFTAQEISGGVRINVQAADGKSIVRYELPISSVEIDWEALKNVSSPKKTGPSLRLLDGSENVRTPERSTMDTPRRSTDTVTSGGRGHLRLIREDGTIAPSPTEKVLNNDASGFLPRTPKPIEDYIRLRIDHPQEPVTVWKNVKTGELSTTLGETPPGDGYVAVRQYTPNVDPSRSFIKEEMNRLTRAGVPEGKIDFDSPSRGIERLELKPFRVVGQDGGLSDAVTVTRLGRDGKFYTEGYQDIADFGLKAPDLTPLDNSSPLPPDKPSGPKGGGPSSPKGGGKKLEGLESSWEKSSEQLSDADWIVGVERGIAKGDPFSLNASKLDYEFLLKQTHGQQPVTLWKNVENGTHTVTIREAVPEAGKWQAVKQYSPAGLPTPEVMGVQGWISLDMKKPIVMELESIAGHSRVIIDMTKPVSEWGVRIRSTDSMGKVRTERYFDPADYREATENKFATKPIVLRDEVSLADTLINPDLMGRLDTKLRTNEVVSGPQSVVSTGKEKSIITKRPEAAVEVPARAVNNANPLMPTKIYGSTPTQIYGEMPLTRNEMPIQSSDKGRESLAGKISKEEATRRIGASSDVETPAEKQQTLKYGKPAGTATEAITVKDFGEALKEGKYIIFKDGKTVLKDLPKKGSAEYKAAMEQHLTAFVESQGGLVAKNQDANSYSFVRTMKGMIEYTHPILGDVLLPDSANLLGKGWEVKSSSLKNPQGNVGSLGR